jgi:hypothetical protein
VTLYFCVDVAVLEQVCNPRETSPRQRFILSDSLSATNEANSFMHRYLRSLPLLSVASLAVCSVRNASTGSSSGYISYFRSAIGLQRQELVILVSALAHSFLNFAFVAVASVWFFFCARRLLASP